MDLQAQGIAARAVATMLRVTEEWREFMKEVRNLRRGWAGSSASFSFPARRFVENHNDRLDKCPLWAHAVRIPHTAVPHAGSPAPLSEPAWAPLLGGRQSAALPDWSFLCGAEAREDRHLGALKVVFCPQAHAGHW